MRNADVRLSKVFPACMALVICMFAVACQEETAVNTDTAVAETASPASIDTTATPAAGDAAPVGTNATSAAKLSLLNDDGNAVQLDPSGKTIVYVGSWCRYSHQLVKTLNSVKTHLAGQPVVFLFDRNEWAALRTNMISGGMTPEAADKQIAEIKEKTGDTPLVDMAFLDELPGDHYFVTEGDKLRGKSVPAVYDESSGECTKNAPLFFMSRVQGFMDAYLDNDPELKAKLAKTAPGASQ